MRAFLAVPVLPPALADFQAFRERLTTDVAAVRWAPAASPHVTLHFFGSVSPPRVDDALHALGGVAGATAAMTLRLEGLGSFPSAARPRVLWWGVAGDVDHLEALALACAASLSAQGFAVEQRRYRPHCTLGRPRDPWPAEARRTWNDRVASLPSTAPFIADQIVLYESVSAPAGVRHVPLATLPLL